MFALVEWKDKKEDGSWSIVPTSHIRDFNENNFMDGLDDRPSFIIEWRTGVKKPRGGWPLYEAAVLKLAEKPSTLERVIKDKQLSPCPVSIPAKRKCRPNPKFVDTSDADEEASTPKKRQAGAAEFDRELLEKITSGHGPVFSVSTSSPTPSLAPSSSFALTSSASLAPYTAAAPSPAPPLPDVIKHLKAENEALKRNLDELKTSVISHMPKLLQTMERLETWLKTMEKSPLPQLASPSTTQETFEIDPGSGVYVPKNVWWSACHANSPTTMARVLLLGVFSIETLFKSNLRGGKSKKAGTGEAKEALDIAKVDALMNAVIQKFPGTNRGQLGVAINQKITELRASKKDLEV